MIVKSQDDHIVLRAELCFELVDGIAGEVLGVVSIVPKGCLVGNDHVQAGSVGALEQVECGHEGGGDPLHFHVRIARVEHVAIRVLVPRTSEILLHHVEDIFGGHVMRASNKGRRRAARAPALPEPVSSTNRHTHSFRDPARARGQA